ncbi:hypothetical protein MNBD_GAMMA07-1402, partial [hydrothermal vent metagenome]
MATTIDELTAALEVEKNAQKQILNQISAKKSALALKEKDIGRALGIVQKSTGTSASNSYTKVQEQAVYKAIATEYDQLAADKKSLYKKQIRAYSNSVKLERKNKLLNDFQKAKLTKETQDLKQEKTDIQAQLTQIEASKDRA